MKFLTDNTLAIGVWINGLRACWKIQSFYLGIIGPVLIWMVPINRSVSQGVIYRVYKGTNLKNSNKFQGLLEL